MPLERIQLLSAKDQAVAALRAALARGDYPPSARLLEDEIAMSLGTSRIPVREALATLVAQGLLVRGRRGVQVPELDRSEIEQIYLARDALESPLYERAARAMRERDIVEIKHVQAELRQAAAEEAIDDLATHNHRFHFAILERSGLPLVVEIVEQLWSRTSYYRAFYWLPHEHRQETIDEHEEIIEACRRRNASAVVTLHRRHRARMLQFMRASAGSAE